MTPPKKLTIGLGIGTSVALELERLDEFITADAYTDSAQKKKMHSTLMALKKLTIGYDLERTAERGLFVSAMRLSDHGSAAAF